MKSTAEVAAGMRAGKIWLSAPVRGGGSDAHQFLDDLAAQVESASPMEAEAILRDAAARFADLRQTGYAAMLRSWLIEWAEQISLPCGGKAQWGTWRSRAGCRLAG